MLALWGGSNKPRDPLDTATTIGRLLCRDIQPQGQCIFPSFFTTNDLLRLSECCEGTIGYCLYLSRVALVNPLGDGMDIHAHHHRRVVTGVVRLLVGQRARLHVLRIPDPSVLPVLVSLAELGGCEVKALEVSDKGDTVSQNDPLLGKALQRGSLRGVTELDLKASPIARLVMYALCFRACLDLLKLTLKPAGHPDASDETNHYSACNC